jgi:hypothetical protein
LRLRALRLLLKRRLTSRLTLPLWLTKSPFQLLCLRHLASAVEKAPTDGLAALCSIAGATGLRLGRRLGQHDHGQQCSRGLEHL